MMSISRVALTVIVAGGTIHLSGVAEAQADLEGIWIPENLPGVSGSGQPPLSEIKLTSAGQIELERFSTENDSSFRCIMPEAGVQESAKTSINSTW